MSLLNKTSDQIPKSLFNYYLKMDKQIETIKKNWNEQYNTIQLKRKHQTYQKQMMKSRNEKYRAGKHKERIDKRNKKKPKKQKRKLHPINKW